LKTWCQHAGLRTIGLEVQFFIQELK